MTRAAPAGTASLAGMVGHELNNIAVPLEGYAELAADFAAGSGGRTESLRQGLEEMRAAIARIKTLASDLESLGEPASDPVPVPIRDCIPDQDGASPPETPEIEWHCSKWTMASVDRTHARRAIRSLGMLAALTGPASISTPAVSVSLGSAAPARCSFCGTVARRKDRAVLVRAYSARPLTTDALRDPFGPARAGRLGRRLNLAVLAHSAHGAGGHVFLDEPTGLMTLALPLG